MALLPSPSKPLSRVLAYEGMFYHGGVTSLTCVFAQHRAELGRTPEQLVRLTYHTSLIYSPFQWHYEFYNSCDIGVDFVTER